VFIHRTAFKKNRKQKGHNQRHGFQIARVLCCCCCFLFSHVHTLSMKLTTFATNRIAFAYQRTIRRILSCFICLKPTVWGSIQCMTLLCEWCSQGIRRSSSGSSSALRAFTASPLGLLWRCTWSSTDQFQLTKSTHALVVIVVHIMEGCLWHRLESTKDKSHIAAVSLSRDSASHYYTISEKHKKIHTGTRLYTCTVGLKTFSDRSGFQMQTLIDTGGKPYSCSAIHPFIVVPDTHENPHWGAPLHMHFMWEEIQEIFLNSHASSYGRASMRW